MLKRNRFLLLAAMLMVLALLAGCNSADGTPEELDSLIEDSNWAELLHSAEATPTPSTDTVTPQLPTQDDKGGVDITADYEGTFVGTWENESQTTRYEFQKKGKLLLTEKGGDEESWTWKVYDMKGTSRLVLTAGGEERVYSFTLSSASSLTLYNPDSGNVAEKLTRVKEESKIAAPEQTPEPEAPTKTPDPEKPEKPENSEKPEDPEKPETSEKPEQDPETSENPDGEKEGEKDPAASEKPDRPPVTPSEKAEKSSEIEYEIINNTSINYSALESVVACVVGGDSLNWQDSNSFWHIMAIHLSKQHPETFEQDGATWFYVPEANVRAFAAEVYSDYSPDLPLPGADGFYAQAPSEENGGNYMIRFGQAPLHERYFIAYDANSVTVEIDGSPYLVTVDAGGRVSSVTPA